MPYISLLVIFVILYKTSIMAISSIENDYLIKHSANFSTNWEDQCYHLLLTSCYMDVVRGLASSSDSDKELDNSESSDIKILDSSDVCHGQY